MLIKSFEHQVRKYSGRLALQIENQGHTYGQLNSAANQVAREIGTVPRPREAEIFIAALLFEHGADMIIGLIGALKAGLAYVPMDRTYPESRLLYMLEDSEASIILTNRANLGLARRLSAECSQSIRIIDIGDIPRRCSDEAIARTISGDKTAYILYTSGSTGRPKGVVQNHRNVLYYTRNWIEQFNITDSDRMTLLTAFSHDGFVQDLWAALLSGAVLYPFDVKNVLEQTALVDIIRREQITIWHSVPTLFRYFAGSTFLEKSGFPDLRLIILGGEALRPHDLEIVKSYFSRAALANVYGQTESSVDAIALYNSNDTFTMPMLGEPLSDTRILLVTGEGEIVEDIGTGEIVVACDHIAMGYWKDDETSQEKFTDDEEFGKLYWTGDLGRLTGDGKIILTGRKDHQVKLRGFRIEEGEIETALLQYDGIRETVVMLNGTDTAKQEPYLCAWFTYDEPDPPGSHRLREFLLDRLPDYMVPRLFVHIEQFPLNPTGKIDRNALPDPMPGIDELEYRPPVTRTEIELAKLWQDVLGSDSTGAGAIGIKDSFFDRGGHSLRAINLVAKIHRTFHSKLDLEEIFSHPTLADMAAVIDDKKKQAFNPIQPVEEKEYYPLSSAQNRMFLLHQMDPASTRYNLTDAITFDEPMDLEKMERTFKMLIQRHESLRTSFHMISSRPVQVVHNTANFSIETVRSESRSESLEEMETEHPGCGSHTPFLHRFIRSYDLSVPPLVRVGVTCAGKGKYLLVTDIHHIISDGTSQTILQEEFQQLYRGECPVEPPIQYKDYSNWQNSREHTVDLARQRNYWLERFAGSLPVLDLPLDFSRPSIRQNNGAACILTFNPEQFESIKALASSEDVTLFMVLLTVLYILLWRLSSQEDIIIGIPTAGRRHSDLQQVIGMFVNTLALRGFPTGGLSFNSFLGQVKAMTLEAFENQDFQFEDLVESLSLPRDTARNPLFDVMFSWLNFQDPKDRESQLSPRTYPIERDTVLFDLDVLAVEQEGVLTVKFKFCTHLFKQETIERYARYFQHILLSVCQHPILKLKTIDILPPEERQLLLEHFNDTSVQCTPDSTIHHLFEEQVTKNPDGIAVIGMADEPTPGFMQMTYQELYHRAQALGDDLSNRGVKPGHIVALKIENSMHTVICILGILKAGAAYMPIDPNFPQGRIDYMLKDSNAVFFLDRKTYGSYRSNFFTAPRPQSGASPVYIIYTSGTTGQPKGVMVNNRGLVNFALWRIAAYGYSCKDVTLQLLSYVFDGYGANLYSSLLSGGRLFLLPWEQAGDTEDIIKTVNDWLVTNTALVPPMYRTLLESTAPVSLDCLSFVVLAGEAGDAALVQLSRKIAPGTRLINEYGPTETTITATHFPEMTENTVSVIGSPISNTKIFIIDNYLLLQPVGVPGEICISGTGLASGYLNRPELTAEKFICLALNTQNLTLYKSGDLAKWLPDGNIQFLGRIGQQVKIRGYRIEPAEIQYWLLQHKSIKDAVVLYQQVKDGDGFLCAYVVVRQPESKSVLLEELREFLSLRVPGYMVPSFFIPLDRIPLTTNRKIDRNALPVPVIKDDYNTSIAEPRDDIERELHDLWSIILPGQTAGSFGIHDNFFRLGGHSLKAAQLAAGIHKQFNVKLPLVDVFRASTIAQMARMLQKAGKNQLSRIEPSKPMDVYPLSPAQKRLYILNQMEENSIVYNVLQVIPLDSNLDLKKLDNTFKQLIQRHESLRTSFHMIDDEPVQMVHNTVHYSIEEIAPTNDSINNTIAEFIQPFDLTCAPLIRVGLAVQEKKHSLLLIDMHHIISDGISIEVLARDFQDIYIGKQLPSLRIQYKDYTVWLDNPIVKAGQNKEESYWQELLSGQIPVLHLPYDFPRPIIQNFAGARVPFSISPDETARIKESALQMELTPYMVFLGAVTLLLTRLGNCEDIIIGTPVAGRCHPDLQEIIGMFVNTLPLRIKLDPNQSCGSFLQQIKTEILEAFENQDYPFEKMVELVKVERDAGRNPLFDVMCTWQTDENGSIHQRKSADVPGIQGMGVAKFDLTFEIRDEGSVFNGFIEYATALFKEGTVNRFAGYLQALVSAILNEEDSLSAAIAIIPSQENKQISSGDTPFIADDPPQKTIHQPQITNDRPGDKIEELLIQLWQDILSYPKVEVHDNFFRLGGHSLKATRLISNIKKEIGIKITLQDIFRAPTIRGISQTIQNAAAAQPVTIPKAPEQSYYPLSAAQKRLYIVEQMMGPSTAYNMPTVLELDGEIDTGRLTQCLHTLTTRHESFRTSFHMIENEPVQQIHDNCHFKIHYKKNAPKTAAAEFIRPFDLQKAPLLRVGLFKHREGKHTLVMDMHHIIFDGESMNIWVRELAELYDGQKLPLLSHRYVDYACWQYRPVYHAKKSRHQRWWLERFSRHVPVLGLPLDYPRPKEHHFEGKAIPFDFNVDETQQIDDTALKENVTRYMMVLAVLNVLLAKLSGQQDIIVGTPTAGRDYEELQNIIGMFVNTLVLRNFPADTKAFRQFLQEVKQGTLEAFENQAFPFEELTDLLGITREPGRNPLFDIMLTPHEMNPPSAELKNITITPARIGMEQSKFDISLMETSRRGRLCYIMVYRTSLFKDSTVRRFTSYFRRIFLQVLTDPAITIGNIDIMSEGERVHFLETVNNTSAEFPAEKTLHQLFLEQVDKTPHCIALTYRTLSHSGPQLSYRELNHRSEVTAAHLLAKGINQNDIVAVIMPRGIEMIIAIMAILKSGAAYMPISPEYPQERIEYMLKDSNSALLLTIEDILAAPPATRNPQPATGKIGSANLAYIIYTSGSTGKPKGVVVEHRSVVNVVSWFTREYLKEKCNRVLLMSEFIFDASVNQLFGSLLFGGTLCTIHRDLLLDIPALRRYIIKQDIHLINNVPTLLQELLGNHEPITCVKTVISGGEKLGEILKISLLEKGYTLYNHYGPTESTIDALADNCSDAIVSLGKPIANTQCYILDHGDRILPTGIAGELAISGTGLARGYLNRPGLTAEKFFQLTLNSQHLTLYRSGDLARWQPDGTFQFLGRIDRQIKIRGFRIELGEIENSLLTHPMVTEATVTAIGSKNGEKELCAYVVLGARTSGSSEPVINHLRHHLSETLPLYMVPQWIMELDALPLLPNGKHDIDALPMPLAETRTGPAIPRHLMDKHMIGIWADVLHIDSSLVSIDDHFFQSGGNSLKAIQTAAQIQKTLGIAAPVSLVFQSPVLRDLSDRLLKDSVKNGGEQLMTVFSPGKDNKIFAFPPAVGYGLFYLQMASRLSEYTIYAFNFPHHHEPGAQPGLMAKYVDVIQQNQPGGPYILLGYSAGGKLCFKAAEILENRGCTVRDILLIDCYSQRKQAPGKQMEAMNMEFNEHLETGLKEMGLAHLNETVTHHMKHYDDFHKGPELADLVPVNTDVHLLKGQDKRGDSHFKGWEHLCRGDYVEIYGSGVHREMLSGEFAVQNCRTIEQILSGKTVPISDETRKAHLRLSKMSKQFLDFVRYFPGALDISSYQDIKEKVGADANEIQYWPTFVEPKIQQQMQEAARQTFNLICSIPERIFQNDPQRMSEYYQLPATLIQAQLNGITGDHIKRLLGRGDFILTESGFNCIEYNIAANIGGLHLSEWGEFYLQNPVISEFLNQQGIKTGYRDILPAFFNHLITTAMETLSQFGTTINTALVIRDYSEFKGSQVQHEMLNKYYRQTLQQLAPGCEGKLVYCDFRHLVVSGDSVFYQDSPVHILVESYEGAVPPEVFDLFTQKHLVLLNGPVTGLLSNKLNLALLSLYEDDPVFSPVEQQAIKSYIPWTRKINDGETLFKGEPVDLESFIRSQQERLVIKPAVGYGGEGVYIGRFTSVQQWEKLLYNALHNGSWLVQEYTDSAPLLYLDNKMGAVPHHGVWGFLVFGQNFGGGSIRVFPCSNMSGVVNVHQGATASVVLETRIAAEGRDRSPGER